MSSYSRFGLGLAAACALLAIGAAPPAEAAGGTGERMFDKYCHSCHSVERERNRVGPSLYGVTGRRAGGGSSFYMYSEVMRESALVWTDEVLDAFLANPSGVMPGTHMIFGGVSDPAERAAIIGYLKNPD